MRGEFSEWALELIEATRLHEKYRGKECVNLIASEGLKSPTVNEVLSLCHDLECRYGEGENSLDGHVKARHYQGQKYITIIEDLAADLMKDLLKSDWVDVRCISGTHANLVTFKGLSLATENKKMVVAPLKCGAHISHDYTGLAGMIIGLETINQAFDVDEVNIDPDKSAAIIRASTPGIVTFGSSLFLFPQPVKELAEVAREVGAYVVYDAAHVLGLISGGLFQDPLREGADFVTSSTHKTFPGPQGGLVFANLRGDERREKGAKEILHAIFPMATSNTHLGRLPALGIAAAEMKIFGAELAEQTIRNAQVAGQCLFERGIKVLGERSGFTKSHQIAVDVQKFGGGAEVAKRLEGANIIVNKNLLPYDWGKSKEDPSGLRIGFQDVTRKGFEVGDVEYLCELIADIVKGKSEPNDVKEDALELTQRFDRVKYGFQSLSEMMKALR